MDSTFIARALISGTPEQAKEAWEQIDFSRIYLGDMKDCGHREDHICSCRIQAE